MQTQRSTDAGRARARPVTSDRPASFTVPGLTLDQGLRVAQHLQERLVGLSDLAQTLKHIHWNVVGPNFIGVHEMLDPQYLAVIGMVDDLAERIASLGGTPSTLPRRSEETRSWDDYVLDRADSIAHLGALDLVYTGVIAAHRAAVETVGDDDVISEDLLIGQTRDLERFHWFVRSHLADWAGGMANAGAATELDAARSVARKARRARRT